jgi:hypothetical protein
MNVRLTLLFVLQMLQKSNGILKKENEKPDFKPFKM